MIIVLGIIAVVCIGALIAVILNNKKLQGQVTIANQETERLRQYYEAETQRIYREAQTAVADAQKQIDQQFTELQQESERIRQHYETESRNSQEASKSVF
jgi:LPS O-antigen subunit length determinant protein (WzzB/FepE family)